MLSVNGLVKAFDTPGEGRVEVVRIERFSLDAGEHRALRGESGSGKTTFLNLVAGILVADEGRIILDDTDLESLREPARDRLRAARLGYIFQAFNLLQGHTVLENVILGMSFSPGGADPARARSLLDRVGLSNRMHHVPRQLSTGQQQRVAVARALAKRPRLVLADEPTGNLDRANAREALALIRDVCRENGAALLLVSHDEEVLGRFDAVEDFARLSTPRRAAAVGGAA